jgi:hypothetical protein
MDTPRYEKKVDPKTLAGSHSPAQIAALLTMLLQNLSEAGALHNNFKEQLDASVELATRITGSGAEQFADSVAVIKEFHDASQANRDLLNNTHLAIRDVLIAFAAFAGARWGGCKPIAQAQIASITQLPF